MATIQNKLNQRLLINLKGGKSLELLARGTADITEEELSSSPRAQSLLAKGYIRVVQRKTGAVQKDIRGAQKSTSVEIKGRKGSPETQPPKSKPKEEDLKSGI